MMDMICMIYLFLCFLLLPIAHCLLTIVFLHLHNLPVNTPNIQEEANQNSKAHCHHNVNLPVAPQHIRHFHFIILCK